MSVLHHQNDEGVEEHRGEATAIGAIEIIRLDVQICIVMMLPVVQIKELTTDWYRLYSGLK